MKHTKLWIGVGITAAVTAAITVGVIHELKAIRKLTIDADDLFDEDDVLDAELNEDSEE